MYIFWSSAFVFTALNVLALQKNWTRVEYLTKPAVMIALFFWLWNSAGLNGAALWFGLGILFSLAGDVLLMISLDRLFLAGLIAFLLAHVAYIIGFNTSLPTISLLELLLAFVIGISGARILRRIIAPLPSQGQAGLRIPILIYGLIISLMLFSALLKLADRSWNTGAALSVSVGALLFYFSDIILAWIKFITPLPNGRIYNILAYHLGQIALIAGVIMQFGH